VEKYRSAVAKLSDVSTMDGTSHTMMTSENVQRGYWISTDIVHFYHRPNGQKSDVGWGPTLPDGRITVPLMWIDNGVGDTIEGSVGFCWPRFYADPAQAPRGNELLHTIAYPRFPNGTGNPYRGFFGNQAPGAPPEREGGRYQPPIGSPYDTTRTPVFVNMFRHKTFDMWYQSARPSSFHTGIFVASFCDGTVRGLSVNIEETVFVQLMVAGAAQSDAGWSFPSQGVSNNPMPNLLDGALFNPGTIFRN